MTKDIIEIILNEKYPNRNKYSDMNGHYSDGDIGDKEVIELVLSIVASTQEERDRSWRTKIDSVIINLQKEFANTPVNERTNAFELLQKAKSEILSDTKTNEK